MAGGRKAKGCALACLASSGGPRPGPPIRPAAALRLTFHAATLDRQGSRRAAVLPGAVASSARFSGHKTARGCAAGSSPLLPTSSSPILLRSSIDLPQYRDTHAPRSARPAWMVGSFERGRQE